jgi:hypothetical protein
MATGLFSDNVAATPLPLVGNEMRLSRTRT